MSSILNGISEAKRSPEPDYDDPSWDEKVSNVGQKAKQAELLKSKGKEPRTRWNPETKKYYVDFSDDDVQKESVGIPYPGTYEETNDMFKTSGQRRIGSLTTEDEQIDGMAQGEIREIIKNAIHIKNQLDKGVSLDGWMYSYVTTSNDHLNSVAEQINNPHIDEENMSEGWSQKYKSSINCSHPKGFSQKAHCAGKKKHNESIEMEMTCPDCGMCQTHGDHSHDNLEEACWKGYHKEGNKKMFGKTYPNCVKNEGVAEGVPQPGESSGAPKKFGPDAKIEPRQMTVKQIISSIPGVPYYNNVVDDWDAKDYSWGVTKKVIEYATYLKDHPESLSHLPPILVLNGKFEDGAHRVSAIWLLQQRMDPKNPLWANAKLNVQFVKQGVAEGQHSCPHCGGEMVSEELMNEKKDACYYKVKSRYSVWPSAYASGALVKCRKKGASNWGNGGKKNESSILEGIEKADESLHDWFTKEKWVRMDTKGNIKGPCAREPGEGKPKCLPQSKAHSLGKKGRASAAARKRREDPNPDRHGPAINVNTKKKSNESIDEGWFKNTLAGAALAGAALTGAGHAHAADLSQFGTTYLQQVASGEHPRPMVSIDDAKAELQAREQGKQQTVAPAAKPETSSGYSIDYLKKAADPDRIGRYLISVEKAQEMLNQATAPRARPALNIAPGNYPAAK